MDINKQLNKVYEQNVNEEITIKDIAGNQKKVNIEITNIDKTSPVISGVENGESYIGSVKILVTDDNLKTLLLEKDRKKVEGYTKGKEITEKGTYKLTAIDKAGNSTEVSFTIQYERV